MKLSEHVKPISYVKSRAAEVLKNLARDRTPLIITQNGEAQAVLQDIASYEETQETMALLKILALGEKQVEDGEVMTADDVFTELRELRRREN